MPKYSILWLFSLTTILAILFGVAGQSLQYAYLLSCLTLGCYAGFASRFLFLKSHTVSLTLAAATSIVVGGSLLAIGTWYTPIIPDVADFVSDGRQTVGGNFLIGAILGYCFSLFPMLTYMLFIGCKTFSTK